MTPQTYEPNQFSDSDYPTSPWTEAFRPMPVTQPERAEDRAKQSDDNDAQQTTHDALSDIYNRGY